jgi:hypothetical protein
MIYIGYHWIAGTAQTACAATLPNGIGLNQWPRRPLVSLCLSPATGAVGNKI